MKTKEDQEIVELYWRRDESAIRETDIKYGRLCHYIAYHILSSDQDCEECVSDTYFAVWNAIPPKRPERFPAYLGRITRNLALNRFDYLTAEKRNVHVICSLEELEECVSGGESLDSELTRRQTELAISDFLWKQEEEKRNIFIRRYWYLTPVKELARTYRMSEGKVASMLFRMRRELKEHLEKEGIVL